MNKKSGGSKLAAEKLVKNIHMCLVSPMPSRPFATLLGDSVNLYRSRNAWCQGMQPERIGGQVREHGRHGMPQPTCRRSNRRRPQERRFEHGPLRKDA